MEIREALPADYRAIYEVVRSAFAQEAEAQLVDALRASGDAVIDLVAVIDGGISGHVLFSRLRTPRGSLALAPVSVTPGKQNRGQGSALILEGIARAKKAGWRAVFLLGDPEFYRRFGFEVEKAAKFETEYAKAYFMALELQVGALEKSSGAVVFARPFQKLE